METKNKMKSKANQTNEKFKITGDWNAHAQSLKKTYPQLVDSDLFFEPGKEESLIARLATGLNKEKNQVIEIIKKVQA
jgi:hypothetical protein